MLREDSSNVYCMKHRWIKSLVGRWTTALPDGGSEAYISEELQEDQGSSSVLGVEGREPGKWLWPYPSLQDVCAHVHVQ